MLSLNRHRLLPMYLLSIMACCCGSAHGQLQFLPATRVVLPGNSTNDDELPSLSSDQLTLFFTSTTRNPAQTDADLYLATRATESSPFSTVENLGSVVNSSVDDLASEISVDGLSLYFVSDRFGSLGDRDVWVTTRLTSNSPFEEPINLGADVNGPYLDGGPNISQDGLTLVFNSNRLTRGGNRDIFTATRATLTDPFSSVVPLSSAINSPSDDARPCLSADGLTLIFGSDRPGGYGNWDLWMTSRETLTSPWGQVVNLGPNVNSASDDLQPDLTWDGKRLLFGSDRKGGRYQIYESVIVPEPSSSVLLTLAIWVTTCFRRTHKKNLLLRRA